jgi:hypothetical protein
MTLDQLTTSQGDIDQLADSLGALPAAPLAMPKQNLEAERAGFASLSLLRLFGARNARTGH